jgi:hypothetical protein
LQAGTVAHACDPSTWDEKDIKFENSLGYKVNPYPKKKIFHMLKKLKEFKNIRITI